MTDFATIQDIIDLFRALTPEETTKATKLIPVVSASLRETAKKYNKDLDAMILADSNLGIVAKSVTVDVVARALMTSTNQEPMSQFSQAAMGYSVSGTYLVAGGGLFIKNSELDRLGLRVQKYGVIDFYGNN